MTSEQLALIASAILSLLFTYIPGLNVKYGGLQKETKALIMLGLVLAVAVGALALACSGLAADFGLAVTCDKPGAVGLVLAFFYAVAGNQGTYLIFPVPEAVQDAKAARIEG
jgi:hypothetical protein